MRLSILALSLALSGCQGTPQPQPQTQALQLSVSRAQPQTIRLNVVGGNGQSKGVFQVKRVRVALHPNGRQITIRAQEPAQ